MKTTEVIITSLDKTYIDRVAKLYVNSVQKHFKGTIVDEELKYWTIDSEKREFENNLNSNTLTVRVLIDNNQNLIGFTRIGADEEISELGWIDLIFIDDIYHKQGYGKHLLENAFTELKKMGFNKVHLWTPTLGKSHGFYIKMNGAKTGQKVNDIGFDLTEYSWDLN